MATKLKVVEDAAGIVPAPGFTPAPTRKRRAGWNCRAQLARGTGEHGNDRRRPPFRAPARGHVRGRTRAR